MLVWADLVAMVTDNWDAFEQVDAEGGARGRDLGPLSSLLAAGVVVTSKRAVDVMGVLCAAGHCEVTEAGAIGE